MLAHLETRIVSAFGELDKDGNVVRKFVVQSDPNAPQDPLLISVLNEAGFVNAFKALEEVKSQLKIQLTQDKSTEPVPVEVDKKRKR